MKRDAEYVEYGEISEREIMFSVPDGEFQFSFEYEQDVEYLLHELKKGTG